VGGLRRPGLAAALAAVAAGAGPATAAGAPILDLGPGRDAAAAVGPDGAAYVAFNGPGGGHTPLRFCVLPREASACTAGGRIAAPGASVLRPFVQVAGSTVRVLSTRYGEGVPGFSAVYEFVSADGGRTFGPGRQVGTQGFHAAAAGPGAGISLVSSQDGAGGRYQRVPTDGSPKETRTATLSTSHLGLGAVGLLDPDTPVAVFSDGWGDGIARRYSGAGDVNHEANWTAAQRLGPATYGHLAGGPAGLFLLSVGAEGQLELRRHGGTGFEPPVPVPDGRGETAQAHLAQDPAGRLHAAWPRLAAEPSLEYATSDDGRAFQRRVAVRDPEGISGVRVAAAADHAGVAVWETTGGNGEVHLARIAPVPGAPPDAEPPEAEPPDTEPPDTFITAGPSPGATVTTAPTFEFTASEHGVRFECSVRPAQLDDQAGPAWVPCTSPYRAPGFGFTAIRFRVRAIDAAGNADPTPATQEYISDPAPYGNVRVRGIDVFQLVQPNSGAQMFGYSAANPEAVSAFPSFCGGGTPTSARLLPIGPAGSSLCSATPYLRRITYRGVPLDTAKPATAIVYVGMEGAPTSDRRQPLDVTLTATLPNGRQIGPTLVRRITDPPASGTPWVTAAERRRAISERHGVPFAMPSAWLGTIAVNLKATVAFAPGTRSWNEAECANDACGADNTFELRDIPKASLPPVLITPLFLRDRPGQTVPGTFPTPEAVFDVVRHLVPGGERIRLRWYAATLDITTQASLTATALPDIPLMGPGRFACNGMIYGPPGQTSVAAATRRCRADAVSAVIDQWVADNPPRYRGGDGRTVQAYDIAAAIIDYPGEPGWWWGGTIRNVGPSEVRPVPRMALACCTRPITAATHELLHAYTVPHAGQGCPGTAAGAAQAGERWPEDDRGRLQGTRFDSRPPAPHMGFDDPVSPRLYDLMSYCAAGDDSAEAATEATRGDAWISPRNWNRAVAELESLRSRVGLGRGRPTFGRVPLARAAQGPRAGRTPFAVGQAGAESGRILRVNQPDGDDAVPAADPASPVRLRSLAADGAVLSEVGVRVTVGSESPPGSPGTFVAPVARGAAAVELLRDGRVLDRMERDAAPTVRLSAPRSTRHVRAGRRLEVRWTAADRDDRELHATVDYSADDGRTWRTVFSGRSAGRATLRADGLPGARRARVRVTVSDGFSEATARSAAFRLDGRRPDVRIVAPARGHLLQAGIPVRLAAVALDGGGTALTGRSVRWFAGRRSLGSGAELTARLPAGRVRLRAVARDAHGASRAAVTTVRVAPNRLRLLRLDAPSTVPRAARTVTVTVAASSAARLRVNGRRWTVGPRPRRVVVRLPARPAGGVLRVPFVLEPGRGATGSVRGRVEVRRR
jgi:hypothetical protein